MAVDLDDPRFPWTERDSLAALRQLGFRVARGDAVDYARMRVGKSEFVRGARKGDWPEVVDCSGLVKWAYGRQGIWLPRRAPQQHLVGRAISVGELGRGDLVFTAGLTSWPFGEEVGHVGIATGEGTVVHATRRAGLSGVVEATYDEFLRTTGIYRGARRITPGDRRLVTLVCPPAYEIERSDEIALLLWEHTTWPVPP